MRADDLQRVWDVLLRDLPTPANLARAGINVDREREVPNEGQIMTSDSAPKLGGEPAAIGDGRLKPRSDVRQFHDQRLVTTMAVPVVGSLLIFSLLIGPPAAARSFTNRPHVAIGLSVLFALATVWIAIAMSYETNLPIGFFGGHECPRLRRRSGKDGLATTSVVNVRT